MKFNIDSNLEKFHSQVIYEFLIRKVLTECSFTESEADEMPLETAFTPLLARENRPPNTHVRHSF
jgi:hypothetical protein